MNFEQKLKRRMYIYASYILMGGVLLLLCAAQLIKNEFFSAFGSIFLVTGVLRILKYQKILKNEDALKRLEITETDERNREISSKALSVTAIVFIYAAAVAVIILQIFEMEQASRAVSCSLCACFIVYFVSMAVMKRLH